MYCYNCGTRNDNELVFCRECGALIRPQSIVRAQTKVIDQAAVDEALKRMDACAAMYRICGIICLLMSFVGLNFVLALFCFCSASNISSAKKKFAEDPTGLADAVLNWQAGETAMVILALLSLSFAAIPAMMSLNELAGYVKKNKAVLP